ncbi:MAG TPA: ribose-phosphate diphosphokinase, partial [Spirochaetia bacterium]|nr:ribose-phosphate diphosphokinase [Spirochaetia bacterium]
HTYFANGEVKTEILDSVRGKDVYIFQDIENHQPIPFNEGSVHRYLSVNDHLFSLFVTIDAAMQAGAERVNLVLPAYPYSRQHKKKGREGLTAARVGQILENLGVSRIITLDIHSREIENCFNRLRLENLHASLQIIEKLIGVADISSEDLVILSPDTGAIDRNKFYANSLGKPLALLYKERDYSKVSKSAAESNISEMKLLGDVRGKTVFMADDMIGTGGTLIKGMKNLKDMGVEKIICAVSLPFFSGSAIEDFDAAFKQGLFYRIIGTNAVYHKELLQKEWYVQSDVTGLFAQIISLVHHNRSVSSMLDNRDLVAKRIKKQLDRMAAREAMSRGPGGRPPAKEPSPDKAGDRGQSLPPAEPLPHGPAEER